MLYGLYASTFFFNVLFYLELLRKTSAVNLPITNLAFMGLCTLGMIIYGFFAKKLPTARRYPSLCLALLLSGVGGVLLFSTTGGAFVFKYCTIPIYSRFWLYKRRHRLSYRL